MNNIQLQIEEKKKELELLMEMQNSKVVQSVENFAKCFADKKFFLYQINTQITNYIKICAIKKVEPYCSKNIIAVNITASTYLYNKLPKDNFAIIIDDNSQFSIVDDEMDDVIFLNEEQFNKMRNEFISLCGHLKMSEDKLVDLMINL